MVFKSSTLQTQSKTNFIIVKTKRFHKPVGDVKTAPSAFFNVSEPTKYTRHITWGKTGGPFADGLATLRREKGTDVKWHLKQLV